MEGMERICYCMFDKHVEAIIHQKDEDLTNKEIEFKKRYYKYCPVIDFNSPMNKIHRYIKKELEEIKVCEKEKTPLEVIALMQTENPSVSKEDIEQIAYHYKKYIAKKKEIQKRKRSTVKNIGEIVQEDNIVNMEQYAKYIRREVEEYFVRTHQSQENIMESIANAVVEYCYVLYPSKSKSFAWDVFGKYIVYNIKNNTLKTQKFSTVPIIDKQGDIQYLGETYSEKIIELDGEKNE